MLMGGWEASGERLRATIRHGVACAQATEGREVVVGHARAVCMLFPASVTEQAAAECGVRQFTQRLGEGREDMATIVASAGKREAEY